eukprot:CAMPEP_0194212608 /NCGR_PEP_ID=MMETSP0156-20130528/12660_1 /TAXON_ID=33649 /ORGANISM="Thalassionema nitzschioides, Strain L26-B" /LENGTH=282 /DNA_ID=CAMNT_0038940479 /DNA_START=52 /DNA_END=901 /DNA_ORIENTATION=-
MKIIAMDQSKAPDLEQNGRSPYSSFTRDKIRKRTLEIVGVEEKETKQKMVEKETIWQTRCREIVQKYQRTFETQQHKKEIDATSPQSTTRKEEYDPRKITESGISGHGPRSYPLSKVRTAGSVWKEQDRVENLLLCYEVLHRESNTQQYFGKYFLPRHGSGKFTSRSKHNSTLQNTRFCQFVNCSKLVIYGGLPFCSNHGGGRPCDYPGCHTRARTGGRNFCTRHGGGRRCQKEGCNKGLASGGMPSALHMAVVVAVSMKDALKVHKAVRNQNIVALMRSIH